MPPIRATIRWPRRAFAGALALVLGGLLVEPGEAEGSVHSSNVAVTGDGRMLVVANPNSGTLTLLDTRTLTIVAEVPVGEHPEAVAVDPARARAYVTARDQHLLTVVDLAEGRPIAHVAIGDQPAGVVASRDGKVYVAESGAARLRVLDAVSLATLASIPTEPFPRALALSSDDSLLWITHLRSGRLSQFDTRRLRIEAVIPTEADANLAISLLLDESKGLVYVPLTRSNASNPALLFDTTVFPVVSVVDLGRRAAVPARRVSLEITDRPVNLPAAAVLGPGGRLFVVHSGSGDLSVVDPLSRRAVAHLEVGEHPTGLALSPDRRTLYVHNALSGTISVVDTEALAVTNEVVVTRIPTEPEILRGQILFNSSSRPETSFDQWISCASCHFEGTTDGRTWFFPDGPRNTPSLLGVGDTLPAHWSGDLDELQDVEATIRGLQAGTGLAPGADDQCGPACDQAPPNAGRSADLDALATFMASLAVPRSPHLFPGGGLSESARRGQQVFLSAKAACASCHPPPLYSDRARHDVGTGRSPLEHKGTSFDTPSLRRLYETAPYLHDGSAATLLDVLKAQDPEDPHGQNSFLGAEQLADLVEFLRSIPFEEEPDTCGSSRETLCLGSNRFAVRVDWHNLSDGHTGHGKAVRLSDRAGAFWFFAPEELDLAVKLLDGRGANGAFWAFSGALSDVEYLVTFTDLRTGAVSHHHKPAGSLCGVADILAFREPNPAAAKAAVPRRFSASPVFFPTAPLPQLTNPWPGAVGASCVPGRWVLCLDDRRFQIEATFRDPVTDIERRARAFPSRAASGFFWFFDRENPEIAVKVHDGTALTNSDWLFHGALTHLEYEVKVTDTIYGFVGRYRHPAGDLCGGVDLQFGAARQNVASSTTPLQAHPGRR